MEIARHAKKLEAIAFDEAFPHVALREAARRALLACLTVDSSEAGEALRRHLREIHVSKFPPSETPAKGSPDFHWNRPKDVPEPEPPFHFDYDFDKRDLASVGNIFGLPKWEVGDRCVAWIRRWDPKIEHMHNSGGRHHPSGYSTYATGAGDSFQSYGAYLARHALALEGGRLLLTVRSTRRGTRTTGGMSGFALFADAAGRPVVGRRHRRASRLYIARTEGRSSGKERPSDDPAVLASLAGVERDGSIGAFLTVDGSWSSPDGVSVAISSVLVPTEDSDAAARALGTAPPNDMWLPTFEHYDDEDENDRQRHSDMAPVEPWITDVRGELKIDERDPYGCSEAVQRARPAKRIARTFELCAEEPWADAWRDRAGRAVFRSLAWGEREGQGEHETSNSGSALLCERAFLSELLTALDRDLIVLVKLQHYRERSRYADDDESGERFSYAYSVLSIDRHLQVARIVPTQSDFGVVEGLGEQAR